MSIKYLLDDIQKDLHEVFVDYKIVNQKSNLVPLNIYQYNLPVKKEEDDEEHFPFIIIRPNEGKLNREEEIVTTTLVFGIYDENDSKQGAADLTNMIEKYKNHLANIIVIGSNEVLFPISWELQDDDTHPAYYGGMAIMWKLQSMKQKEVDFI